MLPWVLAALLSAGVAGCGDDGLDPVTTSAGAPESSQAPAPDGAPREEKRPSGEAPDEKKDPKNPHSGNGGGSSNSNGGGSGSSAGQAEGSDRGGNAGSGKGDREKPATEFGTEANAAEREQAAEALDSYLTASADEDWEEACSHMSSTLRRKLDYSAASSPNFKGCSDVLASLMATIPEQVKSSLVSAEITSLRISGKRGFALYRGAENVDYSIPMVKDRGSWTVASIIGNPNA